MGLDMYLSARKHVNKIDWSKLDRSAELDYAAATYPQWNDVVEAAGMSHLVDKEDIYGVDISVNVAYWRKVNAVHKWFVDNVQDGEDNCQEYYVSHAQLKELLTTCRQALFKKDPSELPPSAGFFFGSYDIDEWYWNGIKSTIKQLKRLTEMPDFEQLSFYYQSSW
jgi:hypothetical protein